jgi:hypothetical protein
MATLRLAEESTTSSPWSQVINELMIDDVERAASSIEYRAGGTPRRWFEFNLKKFPAKTRDLNLIGKSFPPRRGVRI